METLAVLAGAATALSAAHITAGDLAHARELNASTEASLKNFDPRCSRRPTTSSTACSRAGAPNERLNDLVTVEWERQRPADLHVLVVPERARAR
ncbi:hypothetical protein QJS66_13035 [Kocuria rhizophila]|nr:hypothetical protein QJS66_13035 [Kocuria rhizophila]